ncbi:Tn3 family transposase [Ketobacter sp. MCCC 1A13808]|uniref:Tn3 family transposase n=1 Tax=Ketobacter sp. MCCC 1A13808 TaxID=2602738 RepID=UPI0012ECA59B|nr:Tn3 family transposase [Ketobacter sp. MCCC 1A13808]MVF14919.1 Tn3 family transposase [Ketobacter sp. MCCC 1A13808]
MAAIHDTAFPRIKYNLTHKEIARVYTPIHEEIIWVRKRRFKGAQSLTCLVYLKCFQRLGYFPNPSDIPVSVINYIASFTRFYQEEFQHLPVVPKSTLKRIKDAVRQFCCVEPFTMSVQGIWIKSFAKEIARTKENVVDIINALLEILVKESIELPAFSTLERIAVTARAYANRAYFRAVTGVLNQETTDILEALLHTKSDSGETHWQVLKNEPQKPNVQGLTNFTDHTAWIKTLHEKVGPLPEIPEDKRAQFILEARAYTADRMKAMQPTKRKALLALLVSEQLYCCTDFMIDFFIREIRKIHNRARNDLKKFQEGSTQEQELLICMLRDVSEELSNQSEPATMVAKISSVLDDPTDVIARCNRLVLHGFNNYLQFLPRRYTRPLRKALLDCLELLEIDHTAHGGQLLECLNAVIHFRHQKVKSLAVSTVGYNSNMDGSLAIDWISAQWNTVLFVDQKPSRINRFMQHDMFELCVMTEIAKRFVSGDLFVQKSTKYDDYRQHLVPWDEYEELVSAFCEAVGLSEYPSTFVGDLKNSFVDIVHNVDDKIPEDNFVVLHRDAISLKKRAVEKDNRQIKKVDQALRDNLPDINILDLLIETIDWTEIENLFGPLSGHQRKVKDYKMRLVASLLCFGCNLGPTQTARSIKSLSRKQIAYLNLSHVREKDLIKATEKIINTYNEYDLPKYWGTGKNALVDGTLFDMYEQNLLSEYHLRYASYGGIGYYLVSDKYIALFSRFIPCGVREAMHLIDAIIENESDIQPNNVQGDTHAQSTIVFGLAHQLGIKLMPRISNINSLIFFKPDRRVRYKNIDELFSEGINYQLIRDNYRDMLRIAISIKEGKVSASTIARRLRSRGIRNSLYFAFRELDRVVRTQFLLEYISNIELRETIHASTCKSEEFNEFIQWVFFFNHGEIQENLRAEQEKRPCK